MIMSIIYAEVDVPPPFKDMRGKPMSPSNRVESDRPHRRADAGPVRSKRRITSVELLGSAREIVIEHGGDEYRLRITSNDKLILTK
jgi:hemin uptake protein HemP